MPMMPKGSPYTLCLSHHSLSLATPAHTMHNSWWFNTCMQQSGPCRCVWLTNHWRFSHLYSRLCQVDLHGKLFSHKNVGISRLFESLLQFFQLLRGKVCSVSSLLSSAIGRLWSPAVHDARGKRLPWVMVENTWLTSCSSRHRHSWTYTSGEGKIASSWDNDFKSIQFVSIANWNDINGTLLNLSVFRLLAVGN